MKSNILLKLVKSAALTAPLQTAGVDYQLSSEVASTCLRKQKPNKTFFGHRFTNVLETPIFFVLAYLHHL